MDENIKLFSQKLKQLSDYVMDGNELSGDESIREFFAPVELDADKLSKIHEYLNSLGLHIEGRGDMDEDKEQCYDLNDIDVSDLTDIDETLSLYIEEVRDIPVLDIEEELNCVRAIADGDADALKLLIRSYLRLVICIAKNYIGLGMTFFDMIQEGNIGLMEAASGYDYLEHDSFIKYAEGFIKEAIKSALAEHARVGSVAEYIAQTMNEIEAARHELFEELGRDADIVEIAQLLDMEPERLGEIIELSKDK